MAVLLFSLDLLVRAVAGTVLGVGGLAKLAMTSSERRRWLGSYRLFPEQLLPGASVVIAAFELSVGVALIFGAFGGLAEWMGSGFLLLVSAAVLVTLARGDRPECGCFGRLSHELISVRIVLRNTALSLAVGADALVSGARVFRPSLGAATGLALIVLAVLASSLVLRRRSTPVRSQSS